MPMFYSENYAEDPERTILDESEVPAYFLPPLLIHPDGTPVADGFDWMCRRRPFLLNLLAEQLYDPLPPRPTDMRFELLEVRRNALSGRAERQLIRIHLDGITGKKMSLDVLLYLPQNTEKRHPAFAFLNFNGNVTITLERDIPLPLHYVPNLPEKGILDHRANEACRGYRHDRWCPELLTARGYALATIGHCEIFPDTPCGASDSIYQLFYTGERLKNGKAISAWAWGLSRIMDLLEQKPEIDSSRVIVCGHSRLGKAALWAGANDIRFSGVISNCSGCGGAALSRRCFGETFRTMQKNFPHWLSNNINRYIGHSALMPFDQHTLLALTAPRPLYIASASEDLNADPRGEFLGLQEALSVWRLFGQVSFPPDFPGIAHPVGNVCAYHCRRGGHTVTEYDWNNFLAWAEWNYPAFP